MLPLLLTVLAAPALAQSPPAQSGHAAAPSRELVLETIDAQRLDAAALAGEGALVLAWSGLGCPMSKVYAPRVERLARTFAGRGVRFVFINSNTQDSADELRAWAAEHELAVPVVSDADGALARRFGVRRTTEVLLLDRSGAIAYRGAIDDQHGYERARGRVGAYRRDAPREHYLRDALDAALAGRAIPRAKTEALGCAISARRPAARPDAAAPTFHGAIESILQRRCQQCHRDGGNAPFALIDHDDAAGWAETIREVVAERVMPPWGADPAVGEFANDPSLPRAEIDAILAWVDDGAPRGDPARAPAPRRWPRGWQIGEPDVVYTAPEHTVPAEGRQPYRYVRIPTGLTEDRWVREIEVVSTAPEVVHHVLVFVIPDRRGSRSPNRPWTPGFHWASLYRHLPRGERRRWMMRHAKFHRDFMVGGGGVFGTFAGAIAGDPPVRYGNGGGKFLPAGASLALQIHYTPNGRPHRSVTKIAFKFADGEPRRVFDTRAASSVTFEIPPGVDAHPVSASYRFPRGAELRALRPHMHLRGKSVRYVLERKRGGEQALLHVPSYDFDWQHSYVLKRPLRIERGDVLHVHATFDNSAANPANPDPSRVVRFGLQTEEEMMIGYFDVIWDE